MDDRPPHVPALVWETVRELGGSNAVRGLVLAMLSELVDVWERSDEPNTRRCGAQARERLKLLDRSEACTREDS